MIARIWRGRTPTVKADAYMDYIRRTGLKAYRSTEGNRGVYLLRRTSGDVAEFVLVSLWESMEAIRRFAGPDCENAVYFPEDDDYLLERELRVSHYTVTDGDLA